MSSAEPEVSVIIPVRNGEEKLRCCLEALTSSLYPDYETIVVDDSSEDDSASIAAEYKARVIRLPGHMGQGLARNQGAQLAKGDILFFVDADVVTRPDTIGRVVHMLDSHPEVDAVFGSYDDAPAETNFISQYKNLFHHYGHQTARENAFTFWSGCGAIRRKVFLSVGGFSSLPFTEDIELGYRLKKKGYRILLDKSLQVKHLKRWTFKTLLRSDTFERAVPWTELILRERVFPNDMSLKTTNRLSILLVYLTVLAGLLGMGLPPVWLAVPFLLLWLLSLNAPLYLFFARKRGFFFALRAVPMHWLYHFCCGLSFIAGTALYLKNKRHL